MPNMRYVELLTHAPTRGDGLAFPPSVLVSGWAERHLEAMTRPHGAEVAIVGLLRSWLYYADRHQERYDSGIGADYVLGPAWASMGGCIRTLLNGECGRLDCGTVDGLIVRVLAAEGINAEDL